MKSLTYGEGRSVLLTSIGSGSPTEGRSGAAGSYGCWGRSTRVTGGPKPTRSMFARALTDLKIWVSTRIFYSFPMV